jgi:hypothetical protein
MIAAPVRWLLVSAVLLVFTHSPAGAGTASRVQYNRDIRPILSDNCFLCHGPDKNTRKAKLRLDLRADAISRQAFVPGKPNESELLKRVFTTDPDDTMPPPDSHKSLTAAQKELLKRWIAEGAEYQSHWSYVKVTRPEPPSVKNAKWIRNPVDAFILENLETRRLKPSHEADRRTLLRRLSFDLIGLPPTPEETAAFVADKDPSAYAKQVERLLASLHYGERMAVPWLDLARFSDTVGYHGDQNQRIFPYRDYVVASFNRNQPFDRFTAEQLAGDLLPHRTTEARIATGFNRLNMVTREGGAQPKEYLAKYAADRVRTVSITWLGSTMGCAECHDHKFDPFTSRDFYSMAAFFADVQQWGVYSDYKYTPNPDLKGWSNEHPFPPELAVESEPLKRRAERFRGLIREHILGVAAGSSTNRAFMNWLQASREFLAKAPDGWQPLEPVLPARPVPTVTFTTNVAETATKIIARTNKPAPATVTLAHDGAVRLALSKKQDEEKLEFRPTPGRIAALRLERLAGDSDEELDPGAQARGIRLSAALRRKGKETTVNFYRADADLKDPRFANGEELIGILGGWKPSSQHVAKTQTGVWLPEPPIDVREGDRLIITLKSAGPLAVRVASSPFAASNPLQAGAPAYVAAAFESAGSHDPQVEILAERFLLSAHGDPKAFSQFKKLQQELLESHDGRTHTLITVAWKPATTRVLARGNWQDESGDIVKPAPPHFLGQPTPAGGDRLTRLDLARWLTSRDNPLTARVFVNRLWKQCFGAGLSAVIDDVGAQGEWPVHPALLDWLAAEFMESGWDVKHLVRLLVTSATYRQEANLRRELRELDPQNRWLASQTPRRLEAEFVRDNALSVAGLLNLEMGGPSARPYQPGGYYEALQFPDRDYVPHRDERQYRRGLYSHWQRTFLHPMLANFDAPAREECTATRNVSNTPQQALTLLNDPTFVEAARVFASKLLVSAGLSDKSRIELACQRALGRPPKSKETAFLASFLAEQRAHYRGNTEEAELLLQIGVSSALPDLNAAELAAWTQLCRVLLNTHESLTRY